jgi:colanic acid biosynthesis glycosyl transferase WcaI
MRLALLTPHYPPEIRSVSILMSQLARDLASQGHAVTVLAPYPPANMEAAGPLCGPDGLPRRPDGPAGAASRQNEGGVVAVRVPVLPFVKVLPAVRAVTHFTLAGSMVWAGLREGRHDVVLAYSPPLPLALAAEVLARTWHAPFILNVQDVYPQALIDLGLVRSRLVIGVLGGLERRAYRRSSAITVHSAGNKDLLCARGVPRDKITVVPNWVDTSEPPPSSADNPYRAGLGLGTRFVVLFAGVMGYAQDMDVIIEAAAALHDVPEIVFVLAGDGVRRAEAEARARAGGLSNVRFIAFQPLDRYPQLVAASDCCLVTLQSSVATPVVPSKIAGILAASRPVVAALPPGDARRLVESCGGGICVAPGDARSLARAITRLARDPAARRAMGEAGRRYAVAHYSRAAGTGAYACLIAGLAGTLPNAGAEGYSPGSSQEPR